MKLILLALTALALLSMPAVAVAYPMPEPVDTTINPPTSLAGIELGESLDDAVAAWGAQGHCDFDLCVYGDPQGRYGSAGFFSSNESTVDQVNIQCGLTKNGKLSFAGPLPDLQTTKGNVGLGDKVRKLQHAYPKVKKTSAGVYEIKGSGSTMTFFTSGKKQGNLITNVKIED